METPAHDAMETPAHDLEAALARMSWRIEPGRFALVGFAAAPEAEDLAAVAPPGQVIVEVGETSLLLREEAWAALAARHPDARVEGDLLWVTFEAPMGWEVVGFLARVTGALAEAGVPIGAVCGYSRDHLFVGARHRPTVERVLGALFPARPASS